MPNSLSLGVSSNSVMERRETEAFGLGCPDLADVFIGGEVGQELEPRGKLQAIGMSPKWPRNWS